MTNREALEKSYDILASYADRQRWEFDNNLVHLDFVTRHIPKGNTILDVGCGIGILDIALTLLGYKVTGVDKYVFEGGNSFSVSDLAGLRRVWEAHGISVLSKDVLKDDIGDIAGQFGAVISIATIEHQKDPRQFLERLLAIVRDGGFIYLATPNISHLLNRVRFLFGRSPMKAHLWDFFKRGEAYEGHWHEYTLSELRQMFKKVGAAVVCSKNVQSTPPSIAFGHRRSWYVGAFRFLSYGIPGSRDTNIIIARKR